MPIKFTCSGCGQVLRVGDESAGKKAKCPKCQTVLVIPTPDLIPLDSPADSPLDSPLGPPVESPLGTPLRQNAPQNEWTPFSESSLANGAANPYLAPAASSYLQPAAKAHSPFSGGKLHNVPTDIGSIVSYATKVWTDNLGLLVGAFLVWRLIGGGINFATNMMTTVLEQSGQDGAAVVVAFAAMIGNFFVETFLTAGFWLMLLKMARRQRVEFNDLFSAGPVFMPAMGVTILYSLAACFGFLLLIVPGILVLLFWWPCYYLVIDRKASVIESFSLAREVTANNIGTIFLMGLVSAGISLLGLLACCVGIIVAFPLASLVMTVGYLMMSGQLPLQPAER